MPQIDGTHNMRTQAFTDSINKNQGQTCSLKHCCLHRVGLNLWCARHTAQVTRYGHPSARPLHSKLWASERRMVVDLFERNATHAGQLQAVDMVRGLMARASANESAFKGAEELARLARHGVKPLDIITELCAVSMYLWDNARAVPDDRSHDYALSSAIFRLAPRPRRTTRKAGTPWGVTATGKGCNSYAPKARASALAFVGRHLRVTLAGLIANVQSSIASREAQKVAFEEALAAPFSTL